MREQGRAIQNRLVCDQQTVVVIYRYSRKLYIRIEKQVLRLNSSGRCVFFSLIEGSNEKILKDEFSLT